MFDIRVILIMVNYCLVIVCYAYHLKLFIFIAKVYWSEPPPVPGFHHRGPWASKGPR